MRGAVGAARLPILRHWQTTHAGAQKKLLKKDDLVVITIGDHYEMQGTTNSMKIVQV